ncbi:MULTISPECIES: hypothetical protein [Amycolatopsis]|uniref:Uncharacterized protein n=1 Tax=Amycolatopsis dongchuanensis TaxID=1070866 RepID=A0ABP8VG67_9PSEU
MTDASSEVVLTVPVRDGQYHLRSLPGIDNMWPGSEDGLFVGEDNWVAVLCGTRWGPVHLTIRRYERQPAEVDTTWEMAAEWSLDCSDGQLRIHDTYNSADPTDLEVPAGWSRIRLSVRGRMAASQAPEQLPEPIEHHLLEIWPVPDRLEPAVVHGPDNYAQFLK